MLPHRWMANRLGLLASRPWWFQRCENWAMCQQSTSQIFWAHKVWIALDDMPLAASVRYVQGSHAGHLGNKIERSRNPFASLKIWVWFLCKGLTFFNHIYPQDWSPEWMLKKKVSIFRKKNITMQCHRISPGGVGSSVISLHRWGMGALSSTALCRPLLIWRWNWRGQQMGEETQGTRDGYRATMVYPMLFDG